MSPSGSDNVTDDNYRCRTHGAEPFSGIGYACADLGIAVGFGLLFSTVLTLIVVPVMDSIAESISSGMKKRLKKAVLGHERA